MNDVRLSSTSGAAVTIRGLAPELKSKLRIRAAHNDRSMEAEARAILEAALSAPDEDATDFGAFARGLFAPLGGVELELPARGPAREPPKHGQSGIDQHTAPPPFHPGAQGSAQDALSSDGSHRKVVGEEPRNALSADQVKQTLDPSADVDDRRYLLNLSVYRHWVERLEKERCALFSECMTSSERIRYFNNIIALNLP